MEGLLKKGLKIAIIAIHNAIKMGCHINFNIIGDGPQKDEVKRLVDKLKIIQFVEIFLELWTIKNL